MIAKFTLRIELSKKMSQGPYRPRQVLIDVKDRLGLYGPLEIVCDNQILKNPRVRCQQMIICQLQKYHHHLDHLHLLHRQNPRNHHPARHHLLLPLLLVIIIIIIIINIIIHLLITVPILPLSGFLLRRCFSCRVNQNHD